MIQRLSNERHHLWEMAGNGTISDEQRKRIDEITGRLPGLWEQYRSELAAERWANIRAAVKPARPKLAAPMNLGDEEELRRAA
jgi:hypothetical protein